MALELKVVEIKKPQEVNVVIGQSHFIKTVEDIYEALVNTVPQIEFGLAFSEASGACKIRTEGTSEELKKLAAENCLNLSCGHIFIVLLRNAYPINVLNTLKDVPEVCNIFCATANPLKVVVAELDNARGILGVIDGFSPKGVEQENDIIWRKDFLRKIGYKR